MARGATIYGLPTKQHWRFRFSGSSQHHCTNWRRLGNWVGHTFLRVPKYLGTLKAQRVACPTNWFLSNQSPSTRRLPCSGLNGGTGINGIGRRYEWDPKAKKIWEMERRVFAPRCFWQVQDKSKQRRAVVNKNNPRFMGTIPLHVSFMCFFLLTNKHVPSSDRLPMKVSGNPS